MNQEGRKELKMLVRTMYDYQDMRLRTAARLRIKADDTPQDEENMDDAIISEDDYGLIKRVKNDTSVIEKYLTKEIEKVVKSMPIWKAFFEGVKGCGPLMAAACIAEFDIERATTVSKMWQFAGLNPGLVRAKKIIKVTKKTDISEAIRVYENKKGEKCAIVFSEEMVRGDRKSAGYVAPFNSWLRTKLCGVLAGSFVVHKSLYALNFYYPYKERLEKEHGWNEESKGHRDHAAKRYMIKMFLKDLYVAWRTVEGLPVRPSYQEEYLNHRHDVAL